MATVLDIIIAGYRIPNIIGESDTPSAEQGQNALYILNDMLADWWADGIDLGWYPATSVQSTSPLQDADTKGVKYALARELAARNGIPLPQDVQMIITETYAKIVKRTRSNGEANLAELPPAAGPWNRAGYW